MLARRAGRAARLRCNASLRRLCTSCAETIERLGPADGIVSFNVSGTAFTTLRSTARLSPTLRRHMLAAEANPALRTEDGAIFVDRDAEPFHVVLTHLRNTSCSLERPLWAAKLGVDRKQRVGLETLDPVATRVLFMEAQYYGLPDLAEQANAHHRSIIMLRPLHWASESLPFLPLLRILSLVAGMLGLSWVGSQKAEGDDKSQFESILGKVAKIFIGALED